MKTEQHEIAVLGKRRSRPPIMVPTAHISPPSFPLFLYQPPPPPPPDSTHKIDAKQHARCKKQASRPSASSHGDACGNDSPALRIATHYKNTHIHVLILRTSPFPWPVYSETVGALRTLKQARGRENSQTQLISACAM